MIVWSSLSIKTTLARAKLFPLLERLVSKNTWTQFCHNVTLWEWVEHFELLGAVGP